MIRKLLTIALVSGAVFGIGLFVAPATASAQGVEAESAAADTTETKRDPYTYVAQPGDNYTVLARKAVQTYGIREDVNLTQAEIIAAETFLTSDAAFPELNLGQIVSFETASVKAAMDKAQSLTDHQKALWQTYVPYVDFDTRDNGEA